MMWMRSSTKGHSIQKNIGQDSHYDSQNFCKSGSCWFLLEVTPLCKNKALTKNPAAF